MDLSLALSLAHVVSVLAWAAGALVLALILLAARSDAEARGRAATESGVIGAGVLRPASLVATLTALALVAPTGLAVPAGTLLGALLVAATLAARPVLLAPAFARAARTPATAPEALRRTALDLAAQVSALALLVLRPGWSETAILIGLTACAALSVLMFRQLGEPVEA